MNAKKLHLFSVANGSCVHTPCTMQDSDRSIFMPSPQTDAMRTLSSCLMDWGLLYFHKDGFDQLQPYVSQPYKTYISRLMYMRAKLCNLCPSVCPVAIATAQHISKPRATAELRALPGCCQGLIYARSGMSEGKGRRTHTHTHTHTHTLDILLFFWLETPMAMAVGIHSPQILGQLCR